MFTIETKSMLAKLMAKEAIKVQHRNVKTSRFNLETRTLTCPVWTDMTGDLYDLLMGHEIAHALFTPIEGWHNSIVYSGGEGEDKQKAQVAYKNFLNVIEDARIEKLIKRQYPGLRKPMINGYKELLARDFFGLSAISNYNNLYLIDKLNLAAKCGTLVNVRFTAQEQPYYDAMMAVETWDQVVDLANKLFAYSKVEQRAAAVKKQELAAHIRESYEEFEFGEAEDLEEDTVAWDEDEEEDDSTSDPYSRPAREWHNGVAETSEDREECDTTSTPKTDEERQKMVEEDDEDKKPAPGEGPGAGACTVNEEDFVPEVHTDQSFRNAEERLLEQEDVQSYEVNIPSVTLRDIVTPAAIVNKGLTSAFAIYREEGVTLLNDFKRKNEDYIGLLAKEFEMKKAARSFSKAKISTSGDIDITKLAAFRTEDNIFRKTMAVYKGKSHGLILILDKSGSMAEHIEGAMEQIIVMAMFCRKVNIPFAAYSFTDTGYSSRLHDFPGRGERLAAPLKPFSTKSGDLIMGDLSFRELFNSKMVASDFTQAVSNHLLLAKKLGNSRKSYIPLPDHERMGGTPLNEALIVLRDVVREFQATYRLNIVNTIVVHDGDSNGNSQYYEDEGNATDPHYARRRTYFDCEANRVVLHDTKDNFYVSVPRHGRGMTIALMKWLQMTAGCGVFGFYITDSTYKKAQYPLEKLYQNRQGIKMTNRYAATPDQLILLDQLSKELIEEKFLESFTDGYTRLYFIPGSKELKTEGDVIEDTTTAGKSWTKARLLRAFKKVTRKRTVSRVLVSRFIQLIAE